MNTIQIEARNVYGCVKYYIVSANSAHIAALTGRRTVELRDVRVLTELGFRCIMAGRVEMPAMEVMAA